jgi:3-oxoacyl-[acyl-carrier-protein] synthase-3
MKIQSIITGTGSYIPKLIKKNSDFLSDKFLNEDGSPMEYENEVVIDKFKAITGIEERRYATPNLTSSDLAFFSAQKL